MGFSYLRSKGHRTVSLNVCVIGAGASGLVAMKELLDEGHVVTCYEKADRHGGLFYYRPNEGGVYDSTLLTISNIFMAFSSLPPRDYETPRYWRHTEYFEYLRQFAEEFHLLSRVNFGTEVLSVRKEDEKVLVEVQTSTGPVVERSFDAIAICVGAHQLPRIPEFTGRDRFTGRFEHTFNYKNAEPYRSKKVLCIGAGETASDIVHEIATVAESCTLSLRHYPAVILRYPGNKPYTNDAYTSRMAYTIPRGMLTKAHLLAAKRELKDPRANPSQRVGAQWLLHEKIIYNRFLTKNESFLEDVAAGKVTVNISGIKEITADGAVFGDDTTVTADTIVCNTGYVDDFSFVKDVSISHARQLYRHVFHPALGPSIAFIGWARPAEGGVPGCSELQSRYFALLCSNKRVLPGREKLEALIERENSAEEAELYGSPSLKTLVPYMAYMDGMARLIGCKPNPLRLLNRPGLLYKYWFASLVNDQYRLHGPHADPVSAMRVIQSLAVPVSPGRMVAGAVADIYAVAKNTGETLLRRRHTIYLNQRPKRERRWTPNAL